MNIGSNPDVPVDNLFSKQINYDPVSSNQVANKDTHSQVSYSKDDLPYIPKICLMGQNQLNTISSNLLNNESFNNLNVNNLKLNHTEIADLNNHPLENRKDKILSNKDLIAIKNVINQKIAKAKDPEKSFTEFIEKFDFAAIEEDIPRHRQTEDGRRILPVKLINLKDPENQSIDRLEEVQRIYEKGNFILIPKNRSEPVEVNARFKEFADKHHITEIEAILPSGATEVFHNVQFQTMSGATSSLLSEAFKHLANVIYFGRLKEEQEARRKEETSALAPSLISTSKERTGESQPQNKTTLFSLIFRKTEESSLKKELSAIEKRGIEKIEDEKREQEKIEAQDEKKAKILKEEISKSEQTKNAIKTDLLKKETVSSEIQTGEIGRGKKIKVKTKEAEPTPPPPIEVTDYSIRKK